MEGFLFKKARGESTFGRHNWKLRWFILDSTNLSYYEKFDVKGNKPKDVKGIYPTDGCTVKEVNHPEFKHAFLIEHPKRNPLMVAAETDNLKSLWMKAIKESSKLSPGEVPGREKPEKYMEALGINDRQRSLTKMSDEELESAFKFKSLQSDPLHGGDQESFDRVHEAYTMLIQLKKHREEDKKHILVHYSGDIKKGPPGEGFGMVVNVDDRHNIFVKKVLPCISLSNPTHNAQGEVRVGDEILGIDGESTAGWSLARLVQRLNDFRVPVGTTINIMFQRRIKIPEGGEFGQETTTGSQMLQEPDDDDDDDDKEPHMTPPSSPVSINKTVLQSEPAENDAIPQEQIKDDEEVNALFELKQKKLEEEAAARLEATNENTALKDENKRLQNEVKKIKQQMKQLSELKERSDKDLADALEKTESYFVSASRINEAINATGAVGGSGGMTVPEKRELMEQSEAEKMVEVEHRLLKMGLRVEDDPADLSSDYPSMRSPANMSLEALSGMDPDGIYDKILDAENPIPFSPPAAEEKRPEDDNADIFGSDGGDTDSDSESEDEARRARTASLSASLNDHLDKEKAKEKKEAKHVNFKLNDSGLSPRSMANRDAARGLSVNVLWTNSHKEELEERKQIEAKYGRVGEDGKIKNFKSNSPHINKLSPTMKRAMAMQAANFGYEESVTSPTRRMISAKDRIRIAEELDPKKPPRITLDKTAEMKKDGHTRRLSPEKKRMSKAVALDKLGFRTSIVYKSEDSGYNASLISSMEKNAQHHKQNKEQYNSRMQGNGGMQKTPGGAKRLKEKDKVFVQKLLRKRQGASDRLANTM
ncbi:hypothetical protein TrST_g10180 [Triparma strigata]|uniref:PH domain-containing protein n=1 Tax=Triparma strigata TaxID=1606541 RepID=A0A9W7AAR2_9STRA|nr:hypothetical protein TrST_g10180 [Triparma strigata]